MAQQLTLLAARIVDAVLHPRYLPIVEFQEILEVVGCHPREHDQLD
ncbi:hypothetical protein ACFV30_31460 [Streptomyces sp. NPDC059752]